MPSTNGSVPKKAILYSRVSTLEQAEKGYSLAQQVEALRGHAEREGYEVLEEVSDPGQSGASLERPGMDRVRDLVQAGGVSVVLAQDRDRFSREPAYTYLLRREFEEHGTVLKSLGDRGDESPEGELTDGILDQLAKFERAKMAERSRRGKLRKAREAKVSVTMKPPYGFRYNKAKDGLIVYAPEMAVVERIFRWAADGAGTTTIQNRLRKEGVPSPKGKPNWWRQGIKRLVLGDVYKPHTHEEIAGMVSGEVAAGLDPGKEYGVRWSNQRSRRTRQVAEPDGNGGRRYRKKNIVTSKDKSEWVAVPVPAHLPRALVEQARSMMAAHRAPERKYLSRNWELRGMVRCKCGVLMGTHSVGKAARMGKVYHYYKCHVGRDYKRGLCNQKLIQAEGLEAKVWAFISDLLKDPERIRAGMDRLLDQERSSNSRAPEEEAAAWSEKLEECERLRRAYQEQQAAGWMTLHELGERLEELEATRSLARMELEALTGRRQRVSELERDRDALLEQMAAMVPDAIDSLEPGNRNDIYRMLRMEITPSGEGYMVGGALMCSEAFTFEKGSPFAFKETSRGRSKYFASPTAKALPERASSSSLFPLFESREARSS